jgi:uncharacterized YigZ family protein
MSVKDPPPPAENGPRDSFRTLAGPATAEIKVQRSRFVAYAAPVADESAANGFLDELRRNHHDARHVAYAWRLGRQAPYRDKKHDDGEPGGTAGEPILTAIVRADLTQVVVGVVRYFGGVKLGTGGLGRAYGQAADEALTAAATRIVLEGREFSLSFPYAHQKTVTRYLQLCRGEVRAETYAEAVAWRVWLPHSTWRRFSELLQEASAGAVKLDAP